MGVTGSTRYPDGGVTGRFHLVAPSSLCRWSLRSSDPDGMEMGKGLVSKRERTDGRTEKPLDSSLRPRSLFLCFTPHRPYFSVEVRDGGYVVLVLKRGGPRV